MAASRRAPRRMAREQVDPARMIKELLIDFVITIALILFLSLLSGAYADGAPVVQHIGSPFSGLNNQDNPVVIPNQNAQDLLNVDITPGGLSVKKRHGYGLDATLAISTSAVHGGYHFFDANGNDIRLWMNDTRVSASKNGGTYNVIVSTLTSGATLQCIDSQGLAWCVDSKNDQVFRTDGSVVSWFPSVASGTTVTAGPDRLAMANVQGNQNSIYFSASGDFTNFTVGSQPSSPFIENILAPGSHITHIRYSNGRYLWWKDQSFGYILLQDQFNLQIVIVSYLVGTLDNTSVENEGIVYFRGQDNHIWAYDGAQLVRLSREITPIVSNSNYRKSNQWIQTTQSDFNSGTITPTGTLSTTIAAGEIDVSSFTSTDNSTTTFSQGTVSNSSVTTSGLTLTTNNSGNFDNNGCETNSGNNGSCTSWKNTGLGSWLSITTALTGTDCNISPRTGSAMFASAYSTLATNPGTLAFRIKKFSDGSVIAASTITLNAAVCSWTSSTVTVSSSFIGTRVQGEIYSNTDGIGPDILITTASFILGGNVVFHYAANSNGTWPSGMQIEVDDILNGSSTITTGTFTSRSFNTGFSSAYSAITAINATNQSDFKFTVQQASSTNGAWADVVNSSGSSVNTKQWIRYISTITVAGTDTSIPYLSTVTVVASSSGTFYSAVNNAALLTSWSQFSATDNTSNGGSLSYFTRASTSPFSVSSSTPSWVSQTKNATVSASTGTYMQARVDFSINAATQTPSVQDFTFNWFEGTAADKSYGTYFDFAIWWSISYSTATTTNNRIIRYDLINQTWTVYDIAANGFLIQNNQLYFGDPSSGKVYLYGSAENDNGAAINAYWQSKDFSNAGINPIVGYNALDTPFTEKDYRTLSTFSALQSTGTINVTYTVDRKNSSSYAFSMLDPNGLKVIHQNYYLPQGTAGTTFNVKYGNNAVDQPFEIFGGEFTYVPRPWKPYP